MILEFICFLTVYVAMFISYSDFEENIFEILLLEKGLFSTSSFSRPFYTHILPKMIHSLEPWAMLLISKALRNSLYVTHHILFSTGAV